MDTPQAPALQNGVLAARTSAGLTQTELSVRSGVDRKVLRWIEQDRGYVPSGTTMLKLSQALGIEMGNLFWSESPSEVEAVS